MTKSIEFFFDVGSPAAYLAWTQLPALAAKYDATIRWRPMLLGGVFKATGNSSPMAVPAKSAYTRRDMSRYAAKYGVPLEFNPYFPINTLVLMRGATAYLNSPLLDQYLETVFSGIWTKRLNFGDSATVAAELGSAGFDLAEFEQRVNDESVKAALRETTDEAVSRGVFGAPTMFVGGEMFFGQDRLGWVEEALAEA